MSAPEGKDVTVPIGAVLFVLLMEVLCTITYLGWLP